MPRSPRVNIQGILYYVTSQGGHEQQVFKDNADYGEYISLIAQYKKSFDFKLFAYCLMPNHLHMLIELKNENPLSSIMHDITSKYTKIFNSKYDLKGHLFKGRFNSVIAQKEPNLLPFIRHIHLHPKRAAIASDPKDYPYSSYGQYTDINRRIYPDLSQEVEEVFGLLGGGEEKFQEYINSATQKELDEFQRSFYRRRIIGSASFIENMKKEIDEIIRKQEKSKAGKKINKVYLIVSATMLFAAGYASFYYYRQSRQLKNEFQKTQMLYQNTLAELNKEKEAAVTSDKGIEEFEWKIRLAERALEELKESHKIEGYGWNIKITQVDSAQAMSFPDSIYFKDGSFHSDVFLSRGFTDVNYSQRELSNGNIVWQLNQKGPAGSLAFWRGQWDAKSMWGTLRVRQESGETINYSFSSIGNRAKIQAELSKEER